MHIAACTDVIILPLALLGFTTPICTNNQQARLIVFVYSLDRNNNLSPDERTRIHTLNNDW